MPASDAILFLRGANPPEQKQAVAEGRAALRKAIELDEALAEAHASLGLLAMNFDWDWAEAEREFKRAIELNPNYATAHQWYGEFLANMGRTEQGIAEIKRALELDPLSLIINSDVAKVHTIARRYDEAIEQYKRALELDPEFAEARGLLALTYSFKGRHDEAIRELRQIKSVEENPLYLSWLGYVYGIAGHKGEAENVASRLKEISTRTYVSPVLMTYVYAGLGEKEEFFAWCEKVFEERAPWGAITLLGSPLYDPLRSDPRFDDLLRRTNLL